MGICPSQAPGLRLRQGPQLMLRRTLRLLPNPRDPGAALRLVSQHLGSQEDISCQPALWNAPHH